ncbi:MAG: NAD(P)-binding domain-containing protein, partial [Methanobacteriales archaeon]|nr:NAD(P)-binding domain-containing protein [Methanobacteriaceae archaeon]MBC7097382.1 NAD(P)-binding domain-containing protein [Methanobacteriales archaeon]
MKIYYENDIEMDVIADKKIAVIGYGSQGRAQARNMADSGLNVIVGVRSGGSSWNMAKKDGMNVMTIEDASREADIVHILIPDEIQATVYEQSIEP